MYATALAISLAALAISLVSAIATRKESKKNMSNITERLEVIASRVNTFIDTMKAKFAIEAEQHRAAVADLKALVADGSTHTSAEIEAAFAKLEGSVSN